MNSRESKILSISKLNEQNIHQFLSGLSYYLIFTNSGGIFLTEKDNEKVEDVRKLLITAENGTQLKTQIFTYLNWVSFGNALHFITNS